MTSGFGSCLRIFSAVVVYCFRSKFVYSICIIETGADPGIYFGGPNQGPQSIVEGEARIEGAKRPSIEGEARVEGAKRPRIEGEARTEGEAREKAGGGVWGGGSVSPSPENFLKIKLEIIHFGAYLKQLFEMTNEMV